jgi:hypothetical protein
MKTGKILVVICFCLVIRPLKSAHGQEPARETGKKVDAGQRAGKPKDDPRESLDPRKHGLAFLEQEAAKGVKKSAKTNGVELAIELKGVPNKETTDIEVAWIITYTGPRPPLTIVQPTLELSTAQTMISIFAAPKGKDYAFAFTVKSPEEIPGLRRFLVDAYGVKKELPEYRMLAPFPPTELVLRSKDWFVTAPAGKSAKGVLTVSGAKLKKHLMTSFPGEFDPKQPPRLFLDLQHPPFDRGEDFNFDAWTGQLYIPVNAVPALPKW